MKETGEPAGAPCPAVPGSAQRLDRQSCIRGRGNCIYAVRLSGDGPRADGEQD